MAVSPSLTAQSSQTYISGQLINLVPIVGNSTNCNVVVLYNNIQYTAVTPINIMRSRLSANNLVSSTTINSIVKGQSLSRTSQNEIQLTPIYLKLHVQSWISQSNGSFAKFNCDSFVVVGAPTPPTTEKSTTQSQAAPLNSADTPTFTPIQVPFYKGEGMRIGYAKFDIPILNISQTRDSRVDRLPTMRESGSIKRNSGQSYETYSMTYIVQGAHEIKTAVQDVLEQISLTPFISVEGGPFGVKGIDPGDIAHHSIAVKSFSLSTVDNIPNALQVEIQFDPFNAEWYAPPTLPNKDGLYARYDLDDMICWPIFKLWCKTRAKSNFDILDHKTFNGVFRLSFPSIESSNNLNALLNGGATNQNALQGDVSTLSSMLNGFLGNKQEAVTSNNVKKINLPANLTNNSSYYIMKVSSDKVWQQFVSAQTGQGIGKISSNFAGLVDWSVVDSTQFLYGSQLMPSSTTISPNTITRKMFGSPFTPQTASLSSLMVTTAGDLNNQIQTYILSKNGYLSIPSSGDANYQNYVATVLPEIQDAQTNPWNYFGIVLNVNTNNKAGLTQTLKTVYNKLSLDSNTYQYQSLNNKIKQSFTPDPTGIYSLNVYDGSDVVIERISANKGHNLALISGRYDPLPIHSYMGGLDGTFIVEGKCFGIDAKKQIEAIKEEWDKRSSNRISNKFITDSNSTKKASLLGKSFMRVENEIFQLVGVDFVMPLTLSFNSVDSQPEVWDFSFTFIEYDPQILKAEQVKFLPTTSDLTAKIYDYSPTLSSSDFLTGNRSDPILQRAVDWFSLQGSLTTQETYPEMALPTKSEVASWITAINKMAAIWGQTKSRQTFNSNKSLSDYEKALAPYIIDFLSDNYITMSDKTKWIPNSSTSTAFADPDFYCYYDPEHTWDKIFSVVTENVLGKNINLQAAGRANDGSDQQYAPTTGMRTYDPDHNLTHVHQPSYYGGNISGSSPTNNPYVTGMTALLNNTYPKKQLTDVQAIYNKYETQFDQTTGQWWKPTNSAFNPSTANPNDANNIILNSTDWTAYITNSLTAKNVNPVTSFTGNEDLPQNQNPVNPNSSAANDLSQYYQMPWRLQQAKKSVAQGTNTKHNVKWGTTANSFVFSIQQAANYFTDTNPITDIFGGSTTNLTITDIERFIKDNNNIYLGVTDQLTTESVLSPEENYCSNTAISNSNAAYWGASSQILGINSLSGTCDDRLRSTQDFIDWICAKDGVDPNIIRAWLTRNNGFGEKSSDSNNAVCNISQDALTEYQLTTSPTDCVTLLVGRFKYYMNQFGNIPSIALLGVDMEITAVGRQKYVSNNVVDENTISKLQTYANQVNQNAGTAAALTPITNAITIVANTLGNSDAYYSAYVECCRSYGSYSGFFPTTNDPFYNPFNILIIQDPPGTSITAPAPSGNTVDVDTDRTKVNALPIANRNSSNATVQESTFNNLDAQARKYKSALEPWTEAAIYGCLVNLKNHSPFQRLIGAFPSFQVIIINEGFYWLGGSRKLWDQFYTRTGIAEISVFKSKENPAHTCEITFSNSFNTISSYALQEANAQRFAVYNNNRVRDLVSNPVTFAYNVVAESLNQFFKNVPDDLKRLWQSNHLKALAVTPGARIQVRMGYGSMDQLEPIFNGTVVDAPVDDGYITLSCVGDGVELEKPCTTRLVKTNDSYAFNDGGMFGIGMHPSNIVTDALLGATFWEDISGGLFRDWTAGIQHFGDIRYENGKHWPAEVQINIYDDSTTKLEQGISTVTNYFNINAIYNYDDQNLFSVSVDEPTPWKVMLTCKNACLGHVADALPFATRSTAFFGKWWWPYNYSYDESIIDYYRSIQNGTQNSYSLPSGSGVTNASIPSTLSTSVASYIPFSSAINLVNTVNSVLSKSPNGTKSVTPSVNTQVTPGNQTPQQLANSLPSPVAAVVTSSLTRRPRLLKASLSSVQVTNPPGRTLYKLIYSNWDTFNIEYFKDTNTANEISYVIGDETTIPSSAKYPAILHDINGTPMDAVNGQIPAYERHNLTLQQVAKNANNDYILDVNQLLPYLKWKTICKLILHILALIC